MNQFPLVYYLLPPIGSPKCSSTCVLFFRRNRPLAYADNIRVPACMLICGLRSILPIKLKEIRSLNAPYFCLLFFHSITRQWVSPPRINMTNSIVQPSAAPQADQDSYDPQGLEKDLRVSWWEHCLITSTLMRSYSTPLSCKSNIGNVWRWQLAWLPNIPLVEIFNWGDVKIVTQAAAQSTFGEMIEPIIAYFN